MKKTALVFFLGNLFFYGPWALSSEMIHPVSSSMGDAGYASADSIESAFINPASIVHLPGYRFGFAHQYSCWDKGTWDHSNGVFLSDNHKGNLFPAALGYIKRNQRPLNSESEYKYDGWQISAGDFLIPSLAWGFNVEYITFSWDQEKEKRVDFHMGFLWTLNEYLGLAFVSQNLAFGSKGLPEDLQRKRLYGMGANLLFGHFLRVRMDIDIVPEIEEKNLRLGGGFESKLGRWFFLRFGGISDQREKQEFYTAGLGFYGPRLRINYFFQSLRNNDSGVSQGFDLNVSF